jgi:hypothetical protein
MQSLFTTGRIFAIAGSLAILFAAAPSWAAPIERIDGAVAAGWTDIDRPLTRSEALPPIAERGRTMKLDRAHIDSILRSAPMEPTPLGPHYIAPLSWERPVVELPMPDGRSVRIAIEEAPILSKELQAKFPEIRTWRGTGVDDPSIHARLDVTPAGFHAQILTPEGAAYIDPLRRGANDDAYVCFWKRDLRREPFSCGFDPDHAPLPESPIASLSEGLIQALGLNPSGTQLRTYRLAVTTTGEYTTFFGGVAGAAAQVATTVNRMTGIYERDVAIRFDLVAVNSYTDASTDPFDGSDIDDMINNNTSALNDEVGSANYDIGHIFSQGGSGGKAGLGVACGGSKGRGGTSLGNPSGDVFDVDYVSHEVGHQMGADHTFDGTSSSNCSGNRVASSAYEPGGGTTIMAYAGICGADNIQSNSDDYFHVRSYDQIRAFSTGGGACGSVGATGNTVPSISAGPDYTIPRSTPFVLTATGSDPNAGASLTYTWEQFDLGSSASPPSPTNIGPLVRSREGTSSRSRTIPAFAGLLSGSPDPWEVLPGTDRTMTFRVMARDNQMNGGGTDYDEMKLTISGAPFTIVTPSNLECGIGETLTWNKGGSTDANVRARLSTNNGSSFSTLIASTANDGSAGFTTPTTLTTQGRLLLEPIGNIYFALSGMFSIRDTIAPAVTAPANLLNVECTSCSPQGASPSIGTATATDACDASVSLSNNAPATFPLGSTTVTWTGRDDSNNAGTDTQLVTVVDTTKPILTVPGNVTAECTGPAGTPVDIGSASATDACWCTVSIGNDAPPVYPLGSTTVTWTATDGSGNSTTQTQTITVEDTTPPELTVVLSAEVLWPANHKLVTINADITATDICDDAVTVTLLGITSNEPDNGLGDGDMPFDIQGADFGTDDRQFQLRAERSGLGSGRIYTVVYEARDASGNATVEAVDVVVPRDLKR